MYLYCNYFIANNYLHFFLYVSIGHANLVFTVEPSYRTQAVGSIVLPGQMLRNEYLVPGIAGSDVVGGRIRVNNHEFNFIKITYINFNFPNY